MIFGGLGGRPENEGWVTGIRSGTASLINHRGNQQYGIDHERAYAHEERVRIRGQKSTNNERSTVIRTKLTTHNKNPHMQMARTTGETVHGNPGERRVVPANTLIVIIPASNLPLDSPIRYWAHPVKSHP